MAACQTEAVFQLPACNPGDADTYALHGALYRAASCLPLSDGDWYNYRTDYLPGYVTGNDVVALTALASTAVCAGVDVPEVLRPLVQTDTGRPATTDDVLYVANNAGELADAVTKVARRLRRGARFARALAWGALGLGLLLGVAAGRREADA